MAKAVILPKFGFTQEESEILMWLVNEGDHVEEGDPIAEVSTDKVAMEVEAPATGILGGVRARQGDVLPVPAIIAYILDPGEEPPPADAAEQPGAVAAVPTAPPDTPQPAPTTLTAETAQPSPITPVAARLAADKGVDVSQIAGSGAGGKITRSDVEAFLAKEPPGKLRATPAARRLAREHGVDLAAVSGSGPRGRIQGADVVASAVPATVPSLPEVVVGDGVTRVPFSRMRRTIARNLQRSAQEAPHIYFQTDVDMTAILDLVERANEKRSADGVKVTVTALFAKAVAWALLRHPTLNSHIGADEILLYPVPHIGIAVALEDGLIVPVVKDVSTKGVRQLSGEIRDLAVRAREGRLKPDELQGATFTVSNLGMFGIDRFTAIINPPEVAILAVGRTRKQFVPDEQDQPVLRPLCALTLSVDHRVVDGAVAAAFMDDLQAVLEGPDLMLL